MSEELLPSLILAIRGLESGGRPDATSVQGARGSMQIMPGTFRQYAQSGESFEREDDRTVASIRKIMDDFKFYNGDPSKTAAAYFGGRGAVRPDGTINSTVSDAYGRLTPATYAQDVIRRMGKVATTTQGATSTAPVHPAATPPSQPMLGNEYTSALEVIQKQRAKNQALLGSLPQAAAPSAPEIVGADIGINQNTGEIYANGVMFNSKDYGKAIEAYRQGAFTTKGQGRLPPGFQAPVPGDIEAYFQHIVPASSTGKALVAGKENWLAGYNEIVGAAKQMLGTAPAQNASIAAAEQRKRYAGQLGAVSDFPQSWDAAQGAGGVAQLTWSELLKSTPYMLELIGPGVAGGLFKMSALRGLNVAGKEAMRLAGEAAIAKGATPQAAYALAQKAGEEFLSVGTRYAPQIAMIAGGMPSATGDILGNQRETGQPYGPAAAVALATPYAALNLLGGGAQVARALTGQALHGAVNAGRGVGGRVLRGATIGAATGAEEAVGEFGQEVLNQAGRVAVDPRSGMMDPDAIQRYRESAIIGGLVGTAIGGVSGVSTRAQSLQPQDLLRPPVAEPTTPALSPPPSYPMLPAPPPGAVGPVEVQVPTPGMGGPLVPPGTNALGGTPLVSPEQAQAMQTTEGTLDTGVTARVPRRVGMGPQIVAPGVPSEPQLIPGGVPEQINALGERYTPAAAQVAAGEPSAATTQWDLDTIEAKPRAAARRRAARRYSLRASEYAPDIEVEPTGTVDIGEVTAPRKTKGQMLKEQAAVKAEAGEVTLAAGRKRPRGSKQTTLVTATQIQTSPFAEAEETVQPTVQEPAPTPQKETVQPTDQEISAKEAKDLVTLMEVKRAKRERPEEPSVSEQRKATVDAAATKQLHEQVQGGREAKKTLNPALKAYVKLSRMLGGFSAFARTKKGKPQFERATSPTAQDRIAKANKSRAQNLEKVLNYFDDLTKKHGVAKVNAMFAYRKKHNLEKIADNDQQTENNIALSNLWRMYRQGRFDTNPFGLTRIPGTHTVGRTRIEEGGKPQTLLDWFAGKHKMLHKVKGKEVPISGIKALGYYMRHYGRSDTERMLGSRIYHIFNKTGKDIDFKIVEGDHFMLGLQRVDGAFLALKESGEPIIIETKDGPVTLDKSTIVIPKENADEEVLPHELLHAATWHVLSRDPEMRAKFMPIIEAIRKADQSKISARLKAILASVIQKREASAISELVSYGFTNSEFQDFLKGIEMAHPRGGGVRARISNAFEYFVNMVKLAVGVVGMKYNALSRLIEMGGELLTVAEGRKGTGTQVQLGANNFFKAAAFRHMNGQIVESGSIHNRDMLPERAKRDPMGTWEAGFVDHNGKFYTRDEAHARQTGYGGELHSGDVFERDEGAELGHAAEIPPTRAPYNNLLNPITFIEQTYKTLIKHTLPFLHAEVGEQSTFEKYMSGKWGQFTNRIIQNHETLSRIAGGVIDKFGVPETWKEIVDMARKKAHNADQISFAWWEKMRGFDEQQQKLVHNYIKSGGKLDVSSFNKEDQLFLANLRVTLENIIDRAADQGTIPEGLRHANATELIQWIDKDTARLAFGLKSSGVYASVFKKNAKTAYEGAVFGKSDGYYQGIADMPNPDPTRPDYIYVADNMSKADAETALGYKINSFDTKAVWRVVDQKDGKKYMWTGIPYAEGRAKMKATDFTDALVYSMHNLIHDTAANEWANAAVTGSALNTKDALVYTDKEALANDIGEAYILDKVDHPRAKLLARTPGYWVLMPSTGYGHLSGKYVPATVYSIITDANDKSPFFPEYKSILNFWKKTKTAWSPPTHFNNVASSFVMMYMNDIPLASLSKAISTYRMALETEKKVADNQPLSFEEQSAARLWERFKHSGALVSSFKAGEAGLSIARKIDEAIAKEHKAENAVGMLRILHKIEQSKAAQLLSRGGDLGVKLYEWEDNMFRLAAFLEGERRGYNEDKAGKFAADAMINYSIDAKYIKNLRATVLPFLAWPYRMVPMLVRTALFKPWKLATMITVVQGLNSLSYAITGDDEKEERKKLPEYLRGSMFMMPGAPQAIRLPFSKDGKPVFWNISSFMPLGNFAEESRSGLYGLPWPQGLMPTGPLMLAAELALNHDSFNNKPIYEKTETVSERTGDTLKYAWTSFSPNLPLPLNRQGDKVWNLLREKHGITGSEMDWGTTLLQMVGPKIVAIDERERTALANLRVAGIVREYRAAVAKIAREEMRYGNPDMEGVREDQAALIAKMHKEIKKVKGDDSGE